MKNASLLFVFNSDNKAIIRDVIIQSTNKFVKAIARLENAN